MFDKESTTLNQALLERCTLALKQDCEQNTHKKASYSKTQGVLLMLSDSNTSVNSMINRRVSLFYQYHLEASHHMVCPYTL